MRRVLSILLTLSLVAGFTMPRLPAATVASSADLPGSVSATSDVEGRGIFSVIGCVGCLGGGFLILSNGLTTTLAAAAAEGSALAAVTCVAICKDAIGSA